MVGEGAVIVSDRKPAGEYKLLLMRIEVLYKALLDLEADQLKLNALPTGAPLREQVRDSKIQPAQMGEDLLLFIIIFVSFFGLFSDCRRGSDPPEYPAVWPGQLGPGSGLSRRLQGERFLLCLDGD